MLYMDCSPILRAISTDRLVVHFGPIRNTIESTITESDLDPVFLDLDLDQLHPDPQPWLNLLV